MLVSPFVGAAMLYNKTAKSHPLAVGIITSGVKTSAADLFAQKIIERKEDVDWNRHSVFCVFGFAYLGGFQYWLYNVKFVQWCEPIRKVVGHIGVAPLKTALDQCIHHPFVYFPTFYVIKALVEDKSASYALNKYKAEIWDSVKALWTIWVPAQVINFAFVPRHLRIPYVAGVSFLWTVVLSVMQGKFDSLIVGKQHSHKMLDKDPTEAVVALEPAHSQTPPVVIAKLAEGPTVMNNSEKV